MKIEAIRRNSASRGAKWLEHMINARAGTHSAQIAQILGAASTWAYADLNTFFRAMERTFIDAEEAVGLTVSNSALVVDSVAYLIQSADKRLAILCFRGTDIKNVVNWITDMSTEVDPFYSKGHVHGGFYRATLALWSVLKKMIAGTRKGSVCDVAACESANLVDCIAESMQSSEECRGCLPSNDGQEGPAFVCSDRRRQRGDKLEALYICGHSLGGAMAVIATALLYHHPELGFFQDKLRGVYTFGQPMVGCKDFANIAQKDFGNKYFRHVYGKDLVPRLPPRSTGKFAHFGTEYVSTKTGWIPQTHKVCAVRWASISLAIGALAWLQYQLPEAPLLSSKFLKRRIKWSIRDHSPLYYLRTSQASDPSYVFV